MSSEKCYQLTNELMGLLKAAKDPKFRRLDIEPAVNIYHPLLEEVESACGGDYASRYRVEKHDGKYHYTAYLSQLERCISRLGVERQEPDSYAPDFSEL